MDTSVDQLRNRVAALVADWAATLFRPYPSAADLDRLVEALVALLSSVAVEAEARREAIVRAVEAAARDLHRSAHAGEYHECREAPCRPIREALARATGPA